MAENTIDLKFIADTTQLEKAQVLADRLEKRINNLVAQEAKGRITTQQFSASVGRMASEFQKAAGGTIQARNALFSYSREAYKSAEASRAFAAAAQTSQKALHRKGVVTQQVGYQVGDFLVQVQSGTNAFVAFGQQATQLVGVMGMLNPSLIGLSAGLGIAIPLVTAIAAGFMRMGEDAEKSGKKVKTLTERIDELGGKLEEFSRKQKAGELGISLDQLFGIENIEMAEDRVAKAQEVLRKAREMEQQDPLAIGGQYSQEQREAVIAAEKELATAQVQLTLLRLQEQSKLEKEFAEDNAQAKLDTALEYFDNYVAASQESLAEENRLREQNRTMQADADLSKALAFFDAYEQGWKIVGQQISEDQKKQAAQTIANIKAQFEQTVFRATLRFDTAYNVGLINQDLISGALGDIESSISRWERGKKSGGGGGGGSTESRLDSFLESLMTERETLEEWRSEQLDLLDQFNNSKLEKIGGYEEAKFRIEQEYSSRLVELKQKESDLVSGSAKSMYGDLAGLLDMFAGKSKAAAIASIALTKGLRIAEIIASGAAAQVRALAELGPIAGPPAAAKIAMFTKLQAGIVAATGLAQAAGAVGGSSSSPTSVLSPDGSEATIDQGVIPATPQRVIIEGIDRDSLITGEQLSNIFDALYDENENRGFVFEVAR